MSENEVGAILTFSNCIEVFEEAARRANGFPDWIHQSDTYGFPFPTDQRGICIQTIRQNDNGAACRYYNMADPEGGTVDMKISLKVGDAIQDGNVVAGSIAAWLEKVWGPPITRFSHKEVSRNARRVEKFLWEKEYKS